MRYFLKVEVADRSKTDEELNRWRQRLGHKVRELIIAGKIVEGGFFMDEPGAFLILELDRSWELNSFIDSNFGDNCQIESHPLCHFMSWDSFAKNL